MKGLLLTVAMVIGCGPTGHEPEDTQKTTDANESKTAPGDDACDADVVETILQGRTDAMVVALCTKCDHGCDAEGPPCTAYGDACNAHGARGVCAACCDGEIGVLRCHPIE